MVVACFLFGCILSVRYVYFCGNWSKCLETVNPMEKRRKDIRIRIEDSHIL